MDRAVDAVDAAAAHPGVGRVHDRVDALLGDVAKNCHDARQAISLAGKASESEGGEHSR